MKCSKCNHPNVQDTEGSNKFLFCSECGKNMVEEGHG